MTNRPETLEDPPAAPGPYRATFLLKDGKWSDLEGSVITAGNPPLQGRLTAGERAVVLYGEPLLRVRARTLPSDATEQVAMAWLRKFHVGPHHATPTEMAQGIRDGGGSRMLVRLALQFKCTICDIDGMPKSHVKSTLPLAARSFNSTVITNMMDVELERLESPRVKIQVLVAVDAFTSYGLGWVLDSLSSREILTSLMKGLCSVFGSLRRAFSDGAKSLVSEEWHDAMVRWGVVATTSAAQAPWQHGKVDAYIRRVRRFVKAVWRSLGPWPDVSPQECVSLTFSGRSEMDQITEGVTPSQAALEYRPRRFFGDEWDQDWSPMILTDPKGLVEQDIKIRANAREAILGEQTLARIDRAALSKPMQTTIYDPGTLVQIFRETVHQGGRRAGRWMGPGVILATESSHGGKVPRIVHVTTSPSATGHGNALPSRYAWRRWRPSSREGLFKKPRVCPLSRWELFTTGVTSVTKSGLSPRLWSPRRRTRR